VLWLAALNWLRELLSKLSSCDPKDLTAVEMRSVLGRLAHRNGERDLLSCARAHNFKSGGGGGEVPSFDASKHYVVCQELKSLYVCVTRAQKRVVFFDEDEARRAPIFELLERAGVASKMSLLARAELASEGGTSLAQASSPEEWRRKGVQLFRAQRFDGAAQCFDKSQDALLHAEAVACREVSCALLDGGSTEEAANKLAAASLQLLSISEPGAAQVVHFEVAAHCLVSAGVSLGHDAGAEYIRLASIVFAKLGRSKEAQRCNACLAAAGIGLDVLMSVCGIRHSQLLQSPWACFRVKIET